MWRIIFTLYIYWPTFTSRGGGDGGAVIMWLPIRGGDISIRFFLQRTKSVITQRKADDLQPFSMAAKQSGDFKSNHDVLVTQPSISTAL